MLPALFLALLPVSDPAPPARIEVLEGRASLAAPAGVRELRAGEPAALVPLDGGGAHLELRGPSRVSVRWRGTASLLIHGPAALEWGPGRDRHQLEWRLMHATEVHVEVRRGPVLTHLPGGWSVAFEVGASYLAGGPGGSLDLHHDAGLPLLLVAPHAPEQVRPPVVVLPGARLRLLPEERQARPLAGSAARVLQPYGRPEDRRLEHASTRVPWSGFSWPWGGAQGIVVEARVESGPQAATQPEPIPPEVVEEEEPGSEAGAEPSSVLEGESGPPGAIEPPPGPPRGWGPGGLDPFVLQVLGLLSGPPFLPAPPKEEGPVELGRPPGFEWRPRVRQDGRLGVTPYGVDWVDGDEDP